MKKFVGAVLALGLVLTGCSHNNIEAIKVTRVIDGDTIELENGQKVRFLGIDTPERGDCGYLSAKKNMQSLVLAKRITLVSDGKQNTDKYGRLLRYVDLGGRDIGFQQIKDGYAHARYDSRDKYPKHSREDKYHTEDDKEPNKC